MAPPSAPVNLPRRIAGRAVGATIAALAAVLMIAAPAAADPAEPTNYESIVTDVDPASDGATFTIVGGDAFLQVAVAPGSQVLIPGYFNEPYIRIDADGSVWVNEKSPAYYINTDRYGSVTVPQGVDGTGDPEWVWVANDGRYAWHDHRVHWMSFDLPPAVSGETKELVWPWEIPVIVEEAETTVGGELYFLPSLNPLGPLLIGLIALLPLIVFGWKRPVPAAALGAVAAVAAIVITLAQNGGTPVEARRFPVWVAVPIAALLVAVGAIILARSNPRGAWYLTVLGGVGLVVWALGTIEVLWLPILPSTLSPIVERSVVAAVLWAGAAIGAVSAATTLVGSRR